jgi:hypothetical protein
MDNQKEIKRLLIEQIKKNKFPTAFGRGEADGTYVVVAESEDKVTGYDYAEGIPQKLESLNLQDLASLAGPHKQEDIDWICGKDSQERWHEFKEQWGLESNDEDDENNYDDEEEEPEEPGIEVKAKPRTIPELKVVVQSDKYAINLSDKDKKAPNIQISVDGEMVTVTLNKYKIYRTMAEHPQTMISLQMAMVAINESVLRLIYQHIGNMAEIEKAPKEVSANVIIGGQNEQQRKEKN